MSAEKIIQTEIKKVLDTVRPLLAMHKGDVEFIKFEEGIVYVKLLGTCHGCALSQLTLKAGIEEMLKDAIHGIKEVVAVNQGPVTHGPPTR